MSDDFSTWFNVGYRSYRVALYRHFRTEEKVVDDFSTTLLVGQAGLSVCFGCCLLHLSIAWGR